MIYFLGILISLAAGYLLIRLLTAGRLNPILHILLALALGLGIDGTTAFYTHILLNQFNRFLPVGLVVLGILIFCFITDTLPLGIRLTKKRKTEVSKNKKNALIEKKVTIINFENGWGILALIILSIPLAVSAHYFPLGGWDAWSCWNLKAKFIFLGQENWKEVLSPDLWRSNTHYPLLWPLINVWFWDLGGKFDQAVPMLNSVVLSLLTAGTLLFGLLELTGMIIPSILAGVIVTALPFGVTLYTSQYSDNLLGLYLLSAFLSYLLAEKYELPKLKILSLVFLGLMSFTKNEGMVASVIAALLIFWHERSNKKELKVLILAFFCAALPTFIFTIFFAPKNEAFINGLVSTDKPTNLSRMLIILVYPWFEFISGKWNCFWILAFGGILLAGKNLWRSTLGMIGLTLILYLGAVMAYYAVNTFFEIGWWMQTTLSRILFALVPTIVLWIGFALLKPPTKAEQGRTA